MKNKILMDDEVFILDNEISSIKVSGNNTVYIPGNIINYDINIEILDNASLNVFIFNKSNAINKINIIENNNTNLNLIHVFDESNKYTFNLNTSIVGNNNKSDIILSGISRKEVYLNIDGIVNPNSSDNILDESIRVLTRDGKVYSKPMLHVSAKNVIANHGNSIANIDQDKLFYLMMKGIDKDSAIKLIEKSYVLGIIKNESEFIKLIEY